MRRRLALVPGLEDLGRWGSFSKLQPPNFGGLVLGGGGGGRPDSAVSKPNFSTNYAFESSRRDLHNALLCTALQSEFFCQNVALVLAKFSQNSARLAKKN